MTQNHQRNPYAPSGFTLIEILFAIGILSLGMLGIGSLLPVAGVLQKETIDQINTHQIVTAAKALIEASPINAAMLNAIAVEGSNEDGYMKGASTKKWEFPHMITFTTRSTATSIGTSSQLRLNDATLFPVAVDANPFNNEKRFFAALSIYDRTYPANRPLAKREYIWEPIFIQNRITEEWTASIFIMKFNGNPYNPPRVAVDILTGRNTDPPNITTYRKRKVMTRRNAEAFIIDDDYALDDANANTFILHGITVPDPSDLSIYEHNTLHIATLGSIQ